MLISVCTKIKLRLPDNQDNIIYFYTSVFN